jgi:predicted NAD-dependent protein-ADP-ribosyltransferase YbiA (DUF1768 family)|uniref:Uncharacterized protein n=1 Tax=viral metagenome TaxID=1070528 RepID=A0A6C0ALR5_9ZZZZ
MVVSKIDPSLEYKENKEIEDEDKNKDVSLYGMNIKGHEVVIAIGEVKKENEKFDVSYVPVYLIIDNKEKIYQIGVYEFIASSYSTLLDEDGDLDISLIEGPLLFSFVTKDYVKKCLENEELPVDEVDEVEGQSNLENLKKGTILHELGIEEDDDDEYPEEETYDTDEKLKKRYNPRKSQIWVRAFLHNDLYDIKDVESNGDCLFATIREGFKDIGRHIKVNKLRGILAKHMTHKNFEAYKDYYDMTQGGIVKLENELKKDSDKGVDLKTEYAKLKKDLKTGVYDRVDKHSEKSDMIKKADNMRKEIKQKYKEYLKKKDELTSLKDIGGDYKWMKGLTTLDKLRKHIRTCKFWADGSAISILEEVLNIKLIILSSLKYQERDLENVLSCGDMVSESIVQKGSFKPRFYILAEHTGNHYKLIKYNNKTIFRFHEIPFGVKNLIKEKCLSSKGKNIYNYIPKFTNHFGIEKTLSEKIDLEKAPKEVESEPIPKKDDDKLYTDDIVFRFYSKSANAPPGEGKGEIIPEEKKKDFEELGKISNWRKVLSNFAKTPFKLGKDEFGNEYEWQSVEHYYHANKFTNNKKFFESFTLNSRNSNEEMSKNPVLAKSYGGKSGKVKGKKILERKGIKTDTDFFGENGRQGKVMEEGHRAKYQQNKDAKKILLLTKNAKLQHIVRASKDVIFYDTMRIRKELQ